MFSGENLSGSNLSGSGQTFGLWCNIMGAIPIVAPFGNRMPSVDMSKDKYPKSHELTN